MGSEPLSRRHFLAGSGSFAALVGSPLLRAGLPGLVAFSASACTARDEGAAFEVLGAAEAREFEAIAARILPTTDTPGAREAGVIWFMDKSFGSIMKDNLESAREGLAEFQSGVAAAWPGAKVFSDLDENEQDRYLQTQEETDFFGFVRFATIAGFFGMSSYGGNRDNVGWKLLGLDGQHHAWQAPFGHYDAEYMRGEQNDA
ncbi:MAG: gluconate 2-dehydrogenase subunit 3 family protein [Woeseia sp.]